MKYWDKAWSLVEGCSPVSPACQNCWLQSQAHRFGQVICNDDGVSKPLTDAYSGKWTGYISIRADRLDIPLKTKKPTVFAVWSDLFHPDVPADFIIEAFERMEHCEQHTFLVLTKRPERMDSVLYGQEGNFYLGGGDYMPNVWLGTTVENQEMVDKRIPELLKCESFKLFLSIEPMLQNIYINSDWLSQISRVICGCESGFRSRETKREWVAWLRNLCLDFNIPFWVKQLKEDGQMIYNHSLSTVEREDLWKCC